MPDDVYFGQPGDSGWDGTGDPPKAAAGPHRHKLPVPSAGVTTFDASVSGLEAGTVQAAIDLLIATKLGLCTPGEIGTPPEVVRSSVSGGELAVNTCAITVNNPADGDDLCLYAFVLTSGPATESGVNYDPDGTNPVGVTPMTLVGSSAYSFGTDPPGNDVQTARLVIYRLLNPPSSMPGGALIGATGLAGVNGKVAGVLVKNVDQTDPDGVPVTNGDTSATGSIGPINAGAGNLVLAALGWGRWTSPDTSAPTNIGAQTTVLSTSVNSPFGQSDVAIAIGAGDVLHEWDIHESKGWGMVALPINATIPYIPNDGHPDLVGAGVRASRCGHTHHLVDTVDPSVHDGEGYGIDAKTLWVNSATGAYFICLDPTQGAADWLQIGGPGTLEPHAASHEDGGTDEITIENLATGNVNPALVLHPDGAGGLAWGTDATGGGGGGGGAGPVTVLQYQASGAAQNVASYSLVLPSAPAQPLVLAFACEGGQTITAVASTGATWTRVYGASVNGFRHEVWVGVGGTGATVSVTMSASQWSHCAVAEVDGIAGTYVNSSSASGQSCHLTPNLAGLWVVMARNGGGAGFNTQITYMDQGADMITTIHDRNAGVWFITNPTTARRIVVSPGADGANRTASATGIN